MDAGPSQFFFEKPFFEAVSKALRPGGVYSTQGESAWIFLDIIQKLVEDCNIFFKGSVNYGWTNVPSFLRQSSFHLYYYYVYYY